MSLVLSTGSNLGDRLHFLNQAKRELMAHYKLEEESQVYESPAVDYLKQPDFLNQVLVFETPDSSPHKALEILMGIEKEMGRKRDIDKGPRTIDLDILFWDSLTLDKDDLTIPHPRLFERSFIVSPLKELKVFNNLKDHFSFQEKFDNSCWVFKA